MLFKNTLNVFKEFVIKEHLGWRVSFESWIIVLLFMGIYVVILGHTLLTKCGWKIYEKDCPFPLVLSVSPPPPSNGCSIEQKIWDICVYIILNIMVYNPKFYRCCSNSIKIHNLIIRILEMHQLTRTWQILKSQSQFLIIHTQTHSDRSCYSEIILWKEQLFWSLTLLHTSTRPHACACPMWPQSNAKQ